MDNNYPLDEEGRIKQLTSAFLRLMKIGIVSKDLRWKIEDDKKVMIALAGYSDVNSVKNKIESLKREIDKLESLL